MKKDGERAGKREWDLLTLLVGIDEIEVKPDCDLSKFSTMNLLAQGDLIVIRSLSALKKVVQKLSEHQIPYRTLGLGANQILPEQSPVPYLKLQFPFDRSLFDQKRDKYTLPASVSLALLTAHAARFGLKGWEVFTGIPATVGGAVFMNAGTNLGEIGDLVTEVKMVDQWGQEKIIINPQAQKLFSYRHNSFCEKGDVIYEVTLTHQGEAEEVGQQIKKYLKMRNETQPLAQKTCGCVFKNPGPTCRAGFYLDILGLKGLEHNGLKISPIHANFIENRGRAGRKDFQEFVQMIQKEVYLQCGLKLELEVVL